MLKLALKDITFPPIRSIYTLDLGDFFRAYRTRFSLQSTGHSCTCFSGHTTQLARGENRPVNDPFFKKQDEAAQALEGRERGGSILVPVTRKDE